MEEPVTSTSRGQLPNDLFVQDLVSDDSFNENSTLIQTGINVDASGGLGNVTSDSVLMNKDGYGTLPPNDSFGAEPVKELEPTADLMSSKGTMMSVVTAHKGALYFLGVLILRDNNKMTSLSLQKHKRLNCCAGPVIRLFKQAVDPA